MAKVRRHVAVRERLTLTGCRFPDEAREPERATAPGRAIATGMPSPHNVKSLLPYSRAEQIA